MRKKFADGTLHRPRARGAGARVQIVDVFSLQVASSYTRVRHPAAEGFTIQLTTGNAHHHCLHRVDRGDQFTAVGHKLRDCCLRSELVLPVIAANALMRLGHGLYGVTDPFVQEIWGERRR